ncbi:type 2 DNA topoisomerase 6 subunit B-like isoform X2 [Asparagus officinalis]|uniref:type 2 DNA topoisomerase 6 subunit B-like isoform X2 n=1 Tax=Asparagus officinalis TaxID=4686 RepID=UPI00098DFF2D|nr:type 2 DNA topoisomerase 6 subunit B-like isoform X2 [Asparagus officinalis]
MNKIINPLLSMENPQSTARKLIPILIASSVRRCQISGVLCRLTISLKFFCDSNPKSVRISISDTGIGSSLVEFQELEVERLGVSDKWDGMISVTTTGINDKEIHHYRLNLNASKTKLKRLPPTEKNCGTFSGTEVGLSTLEEDKADELMAWVVHFIQKNVAIELVAEHIDGQHSRRDHLLQQNDDNSLPISSSCIERLASGLENYVLKHGNIVEENCQTCAAKREHLKVGTGQASNTGNGKSAGHIVDVAIVIATMSSEQCCWRANSSVTQVLYFQDFSLASISDSSLSALISVNWQNYGLKLKSNFVDKDSHAVLEWDNIPLFSHIDIAIHSYNKVTTLQSRQKTAAERALIKKAVKNAMDDLKAKDTGLFLSSNALKVRQYVPELSRAIAGLITSSNDWDFQSECASLLGLDSDEADQEEIVESCIRDKIVGIIEINDRKVKGERGTAPCLFESESLYEEEEYPDEDCDGLEEEDFSVLDDF